LKVDKEIYYFFQLICFDDCCSFNLYLNFNRKIIGNRFPIGSFFQAVLLVLQVFALISTSNRTNTDRNYNDYFTKFIIVLMDLFRTDRTLLEARGSFIIRFEYFFY